MKRSALLACALSWACGGKSPPAPCTSSGRTVASAVTAATFARQVDPAKHVSEGLNIDGVVSDGTDEAGCWKRDDTAPDGTLGIDNQIGQLMPTVESFVGKGNIDAVLGQAITNGQLLILVAVRGVDDPQNDDCVDVAFGAGTGTPLLDASGKYMPYQTFGWNAALAPVSTLYRGRIQDGVLTAGPGDLVLPVRILDAKFNLSLHLSRVQMTVAPDPLVGGAALAGFVGGGIEADDLGTAVEALNISQDAKNLIPVALKANTDLAERDDGACHELSAALKLETTPAYIQGE